MPNLLASHSTRSIKPVFPQRHCLLAMVMCASLPFGGAYAAADSYLKGSFGPVASWPLIPIHVALLPDGRVLSYGTDAKGNQTGQFIYDVWNPTRGTVAASHLTLPNTTGTDTFCSGQVVLPASGAVLLTGGDKTINGTRNFSVNDVNLFDYARTTLYSAGQPMANLRWYPAVLTTARGEVLVMGGRSAPNAYVPTPEVYTEGVGWRSLGAAASDDAYGTRNWSYPRGWVAPSGKVFIATIWGGTYFLSPEGDGQLTQTPLTLPEGSVYLPSVMYRPGKILALRKLNKALNIDLNGTSPVAKSLTGVGQDRYHASATVMADGKVFVQGGSFTDNVANGVAYTAKIWNPDTSAWSTAATAVKMRLYHSVSLLLPDATVLTAGGGAPGPQTNLNAEIFTPPYLYNPTVAGTLATRPIITSAPTTVTWGGVASVTTNVTGISKVALVKTGSATHTLDFDQRYVPLTYTSAGSSLSVNLPASPNVAPPGFYMLFVFSSAGVPSVAKIVRLG
jgi:hypothetical protein